MKKPYHLMTAQERLRARIEQNLELEERISNGHLPKHRGSGFTHAQAFPVVWFWIKKLSATGIHPSHRQVVAAMLDDPENKDYAVEEVDKMVSWFSQTKTVDEKEKTPGKHNPYGPLFDQIPVDGCYVFILKDRPPISASRQQSAPSNLRPATKRCQTSNDSDGLECAPVVQTAGDA
jgi:hypothetical protein